MSPTRRRTVAMSLDDQAACARESAANNTARIANPTFGPPSGKGVLANQMWPSRPRSTAANPPAASAPSRLNWCVSGSRKFPGKARSRADVPGRTSSGRNAAGGFRLPPDGRVHRHPPALLRSFGVWPDITHSRRLPRCRPSRVAQRAATRFSLLGGRVFSAIHVRDPIIRTQGGCHNRPQPLWCPLWWLCPSAITTLVARCSWLHKRASGGSDDANPLDSERHRIAASGRVDARSVAARDLGLPLVSGHPAAARRPQRRGELRVGLLGRVARARFGRGGQRLRPVAHGLGVARRGLGDADLGVRRDDRHGHLLRAARRTDRNGRQRFGRDLGRGGHRAPSPHGGDDDCRRNRYLGVVWPRRHLHRRPALARLGGLRQSGAAVCQRRSARADRGHQPARGQPRLPTGRGDAAGGRLAALQPLATIRQKARLRHRPLHDRVDFEYGHLFQHLPLGGAGRSLRRVAGARFRGLRASARTAGRAAPHGGGRVCASRRVQCRGGHASGIRPRDRAAGGAGSASRMRDAHRRHCRRNGNHRHLGLALHVFGHQHADCPSLHVLRGLAKVRGHRVGLGCASVPLLAKGHRRRSRTRQPKQRKPRWRRGHKRPPRRRPHAAGRLHLGGDDEVPRPDRRLHVDDLDHMRRRIAGIGGRLAGRGRSHEWLE